MANTMKAMVLEEFNKPLVLRELPIPQPAPGQVRVKVKANGVCATDLKIKAGTFPFVKTPLILGHEVAGVIDQLGEGCSAEYHVGDPVVIRVHDYCGECHFCKKNVPFFCENMRGMLGFKNDGGYAEYTVVPERVLVKIPEGVSFEKAAVATDSVVTAYQALARRIHIQPGDSVLIMGVGGLGMNGVQIAKALGATVIAADIADDKLELAKTLGADHVFNTTKVDLPAECRKVTGGYGVDWSAEFVGHTASTELALACLASGGTQVQPGYSPSETFTIAHFDLVSRGIGLLASRGSAPESYPGALQMIADGKIDPQIDPNSRIRLEDVNELHEKLAAGKVIGRAVILYD